MGRVRVFISAFLGENHYIPMEFMDRKVGMKVGGVVGKVLANDWRDKGGCWVDFIRVKVLLDTTKPLRSVACFTDKKGQEVTCVLKYEHLPIFCYVCGRIDHGTQKCNEAAQSVNPKDY